MFHWIFFLNYVQSESFIGNKENCKLIQDNEDQIDTLVDLKTKRKWFWIGLLELLPACIGLLLTEIIPFVFIQYDYLFAGVTVSLIVSALFKNKAPHPPIQLQQKTFTFNA